MGEAAPASVGVGTMLAGTYRVTGLLGRGGMGSVWVAEHSRLPGKKVAIKVLHRDVAADEESLARFRREAEIATRLGHPNIVEVHDFNLLDDGTPYLVLELLAGQDLATRLHGGAMPLDEVCSVVRMVGSALATAHRENIVHRDLKPHNVFLCPTESGGLETVEAKVLDFGISKIRGSQTVKTNAATMLGTPQYMAPEQALGNHNAVDARTDIFALGAMVYEMLSGRPAFLGESIPEVVFKVVYEEPPRLDSLVAVPPGVVDAVHKALAKKQEDRFPDVTSFIEALTGSPLHTLRKGAVVAPGDGGSAGAPTQPPPAIKKSDKAQVTSQEAYAATVGSAPRPVDPALAQTVDSSKQPIDASLAATMASGKADAVAPEVTLRQEQAARRSRPGMWIGLMVAGVAVAAIVGLVGLRGGGGDDEGGVAAADGPAPNAGNATGVGAAGRSTAAERPIELAKPPEPKTAPRPPPEEPKRPEPKQPEAKKPEAKKPVATGGTGEPDEPPAGEGNAELREIIDRAEAELRAGQADRAIAEASRANVIRKTARAQVIKAKAYCLKNDFGMAKATLAGIRAPHFRKAVRDFCFPRGVDLR